MYINKDGKYYKQSLIEISPEEILNLLNKQEPIVETKLELEDFNFRISSTKWEIKELNGEKVKINPEGDITEFLEGEFKGEQLFTWGACMRETEKRDKRVPTDDEFNELLKNKEDLKNLKLAGYRDTDGVTFDSRGYYTYLWSSTPSAGNAYDRTMYWDNSTVYRFNYSQAYGFSCRCILEK